jgi:hypothetical protein
MENAESLTTPDLHSTKQDSSYMSTAERTKQTIDLTDTEASMSGKFSSSSQSRTTQSSREASGKTYSRNVSFDETVLKKGSTNSNSLRAGNLQGSQSSAHPNPYLKKLDTGIFHAQRSPNAPARVDKVIALQKNTNHLHIHCYTLRFKTIKAKSEDEGHQIVQDTLQRFLEIILQVDPKSIIPPYLELDRNDKSVSDLSSAFPVSSVDSYHALKKYFFRLSARDEGSLNWCSLILAQSLPFVTFMEKAKYSLENYDFRLWPKASDNENSTDVGWLLYSTRAQDEERLSVLLSRLLNGKVGVN